jgi:hypothetical protein
MVQITVMREVPKYLHFDSSTIGTWSFISMLFQWIQNYSWKDNFKIYEKVVGIGNLIGN